MVPMFATETTSDANVLIIENEAWRTDLAVVADGRAATVRISDCGAVGAFTARLAANGGLRVPDIAGYQCSGVRLGVVRLSVLSGKPRIWTEASYRDALGNRNVVMLPTLPDALPQSYAKPSGHALTALYTFEGVENSPARGKSTFVALIPDRPGTTRVEITAVSYADGAPAVTDSVTIDGFTFYELKTPVEFGRLVIKHVASWGESHSDMGLFAVAFIGDRVAGSPRVELPRTVVGVAMPSNG